MTGPIWSSLPDGWRTGQVKNVASVTLGKMLQGKDSGDDVLAPYMRAANVQPDGVLALSDAKEMWFGDSELSALDLRRGDVVVVEGGQGGFGRAAFVVDDLKGWGFQNSINRLRPANRCDGRYLAYFLIALRASGFIHAFCNIVSMPHFTAEKLARTPMPIPPEHEQRAIADFLDRETARIDTLIAKQEQLITTLRERRSALIDNRLSCVQGAQTLKLGWLFSFHNGDRGSSYPARAEMTEDGVPFINAGHLRRGQVDFSEMNYVTESKYDEMGGAKVQRGDILFCLRGSLGKTGLYDDPRVGSLASSLVALRPLSDEINVQYTMYLLDSRATNDQIRLAQTGTAQPNLAVSQLRQFTYPWPAEPQQRELVKYLDEQTAKIDTLIAKTERFIELSKERRSALITAAVTGQLDARGEVA